MDIIHDLSFAIFYLSGNLFVYNLFTIRHTQNLYEESLSLFFCEEFTCLPCEFSAISAISLL